MSSFLKGQNMDIINKLAEEFKIKTEYAQNIVNMLSNGDTIPFIARYRKEKTGSLDDQVLRKFADRVTYLNNLEETREKYAAVILEAGALTDEIKNALYNATTLTELDDIYRPFRPKKRTRATVAKEKGLEPLAKAIYEQKDGLDVYALAKDYINENVLTVEDALKGAMDIIAEIVSDDANIRRRLRYVIKMNGFLCSKTAKKEDSVYRNYYDYKELLKKIPSHRVLAINRGEKEDYLKVSIDFSEEKALNIVFDEQIKGNNTSADIVKEAAKDSYNRLIFPSIERELRNELTDIASESAINVFALNLKQLLLQPPVKGKVTLGLDPGYQHGCKTAVIDAFGNVLDTGIVYPVEQFKRIEEAKKTISAFIEKFGVQIIAIGNGTASHETEVFVAELLKEKQYKNVAYMVVSEAGASVYSASPLAAKEFPDYDVNLRSAVSIARRIEDPLAELIKIDPKSIGVGQYQHDLPQNRLTLALDGVVEDCVNSVGADLNTASASLLEHVAGIKPTVAQNIVKYREENGGFKSRNELNKVDKLGPKAFKQCAGFLRVNESDNPLDKTSVHPESYESTKKLLKMYNMSTDNIDGLENRVEADGFDTVAEKIGVGVPTLKDIISELKHPALDPRDELPPPLLRTDVLGIESLKEGMELKGTVRNLVDFGAFVDIGVHQDGLVHISQITDKFIKHPSEVLKVGDVINVWVVSVDIEKKRISLTAKKPN